MKNLISTLPLLLILSACSNSVAKETANTANPTSPDSTSASSPKKPAAPTEIVARKQVPILCYHHIRPIQMSSKANKGYEVTVDQFKAQMKVLADSGYHTVSPDQLQDYLLYGTSLPENPVMLTYDDTDEEQFSIAKTEMDKYGFKGVYFIMTISIGRPHYMSKEQIKQLSDEGHTIASHTWDHHRVDKYVVGDREIMDGNRKKIFNDWDVQLAGTKKKLEEITGKPVEYFAYPFGIWSKDVLKEINDRGYKMAFQLSTVRDSTQPLLTVRRMIVSPEWSANGVLKVMRSTFK